jgi:hypothetical protein
VTGGGPIGNLLAQTLRAAARISWTPEHCRIMTITLINIRASNLTPHQGTRQHQRQNSYMD